MYEPLDGVKVGDLLCLSSRGGERMVTVEKVTTTQVVVEGARYNIKDGRARARDPFYFLCLSRVTDEQAALIVERNKRAKLAETLHGLSRDVWALLPSERLKAIWDELQMGRQ